MKYPHLAAQLFDTPLLVHPDKAQIMGEILAARCSGYTAEEASAIAERRTGAALSDNQKARFGVRVTEAGISIIPVDGSLVHRSLGMEPYSGMRSYEDLQEFILDAATDPAIRGILLDIDSPGGAVSGIGALSDTLAEAGKIKPVWAAANDSAYSAAYWIGCTADRLYVPRTGGVGSVGVVMVHYEMSQKLEDEGYSVKVFRFGERKADLNSFEPLTAAAIENAQAEIDRLGEMFVAHVATSRGMTTEAVKATEAGTFHGDGAVAAGLADAVGNLQQAHEELVAHIEGRGLSLTPRGTAAHHSPQEESMEGKDEPAGTAEAAEDKDTQVIDLQKEKASAVMEDRAYRKEVLNLCTLAGQPALAEDFIEKDLSAEEVGQRLLDLRALADVEAVDAGHEGVEVSKPGVDMAAVSADVYGRYDKARGSAAI